MPFFTSKPTDSARARAYDVTNDVIIDTMAAAIPIQLMQSGLDRLMSYHQSACRMKKMTTPASNAQSAIRSNVESKKAPNWVPPVVSAAIEPSRESASTSNVSTTAPANNHPVMPVAKATTMVPIAPITVTAFAVRPRDTSALANGSISLLNGARRCSNMRIPVLRKAKGRASVSM